MVGHGMNASIKSTMRTLCFFWSLLLLFVGMGASAALASQVPMPTDGLAAYYPFNGSANDESGNGANGIVLGAVLAPDRSGNPDSAYAFDGAGAFIGVDAPPCRFAGEFSISFWAKALPTRSRVHVLSLGSSEKDNLDFDFNDGNGLWVFWNGGGSNGISAGKIGEFTDGSWHQFLLQRAGTAISLYVDGIPKGATEYAAPFGSAVVMNIGKSSAGPNWSYVWDAGSWDGIIDEVLIYDRAVALEEMGFSYQVTAAAEPNGSIAGPSTVGYGERPTYSFTPDAGYQVANVWINGISVGAVSSYTFTTGITAPVTIEANFAFSLADGLTAYYPFDGNADDASGNGHDGTNIGATSAPDRFGNPIWAYAFNGANASVEVAGSPSYFPGDFSVAFWVKASPSVNRMHALSLGDAGQASLDFDFNDGAGLSLLINGGASAINVGDAGDFTDGSWRHVLLQRIGTRLQLYLDGTLKGGCEYSLPMGSQAIMRIGRGSLTDSRWWWNGCIDDLRIYNRSLMDVEITALASSPQSGLVAYYPFSGNARDESGCGNDARILGAHPTRDRFGNPNNAYAFNGSNNSIEETGGPTSFVADFSFSFWEKAEPTTDKMNAVSIGNVNLDNLDFAFNDDAGIWVYWNSGGANRIIAGSLGEFTDGAWHNVLLRKSGNMVQLYVDGLLRGASLSAATIGSQSVMRMGRSSSGTGGPWWKGALDEVRVYGRSVIDEEIADLAASPAGKMAAYFPLDGDANDESGNNVVATNHGALLTADRFANPDAAYAFNGADAFIEIDASPTKFPSDFCISFWEEAPASTNRMHALSLGKTDSSNLDFDFNDQSGLWVYWNGGGSNAIKTGPVGAFTDGAWHHVLLQRIGSQVQLYLDGTLRGTTEYASPIGSQDVMQIGGGSVAGWRWKGMIDDVRVYAHALTLDEISLQVDQKRPGASLGPSSGLLAYYRFDGNAHDASGNGFDGTIIGAVPTKDRFEKPNNAYAFHGSSSIEVANGPTSFNGDFSLSFWERASSTTNGMHALSFGADGLGGLDFFFNGGSGLSVSWSGGGANTVTAGQAGAFTDSAWHHVLLQRIGKTVQLYLDGTLLGTTEYASPIGSQAMHIGRGFIGTGWWSGALDDLRIYNRSLGSDEIITQVYQWKLVKPMNFMGSTLAAYYPFDGDAKDATGKGADGAIMGAVPATDRYENPNRAYAFNGINSSVEMANSPAIFAGDFAVSFWEKASPSKNRMHAASLGDCPLDNLDFDFNDGAGLWVFWNGSGSNAIRAGHVGDFTDGAWHHVLLQRVGSVVQLYVDGLLLGNTKYVSAMGSQTIMRLGRSSSGPNWPYQWSAYWWDGTIDDVSVFSRALIDEEVLALAASPTESLVAYYPLDGTALDACGDAPDGTISGVVATADRFGNPGGAFFFNGTDASIEVNPSPTLFPGDFSIAFWENASCTSSRMHALSLGNPGTGNLDFSFNNGAGLSVAWNGTGSGVIAAGQVGEFTDGTWHHVQLQRTGTQLQLHIDGTLKGTSVEPASIGSLAALHIGRDSAGSGWWWNGAVDEVRIYDHTSSSDGLAQFGPRDGAGALTYDGKMWLLGGWNPNVAPATDSEVWYSTNGSNWTLASVAPWEGRHCGGYTVFNDRMWIVGGDTNSYHYQNDVWSSSDGIAWRLEANAIQPSPGGWGDRVTHYVLSYHGKIWLMGGQQITAFTGDNGVFNDVWNSADGINWTQVTTNAGWSPRGQILGSVVFNDKMWVIGGGTFNDPRQYYNDVWSSTDGVQWEQVLDKAPWSPREYHNTVVFGNKMWVLNGENENNSPVNLSSIWYSSDGKNWNRLPNVPMAGKHAGSVFVYNNEMWMVAGTSNNAPSAQVSNDVWKLTYGS
jgi:hypothetical protein